MRTAAEAAIKYLATLFPKKGHEESCGMYVMTVEAFLCFSLPCPSLPPSLRLTAILTLPSRALVTAVNSMFNVYIVLIYIFTHTFMHTVQLDDDK